MIFAFKDCFKNVSDKKLKPRMLRNTESSHFDKTGQKKPLINIDNEFCKYM